MLWRTLRLGRLALILQPWLRALDGHLPDSQKAAITEHADVILTVAHGLSWIEAMAVARACHLPLITVAHD